MASVSTSHLILFIASMLVAASVSGVFINGIERLSGAVGDQSIDVSSDIRTDVEIISDQTAGNIYNEEQEQITVYIKNTGTRRLPPSADAMDVLVDGTYQTDVSVTVLDGSDWDVGNVVEARINTTLSTGDHRVLVIVNGDRETLEFKHNGN